MTQPPSRTDLSLSESRIDVVVLNAMVDGEGTKIVPTCNVMTTYYKPKMDAGYLICTLVLCYLKA